MQEIMLMEQVMKLRLPNKLVIIDHKDVLQNNLEEDLLNNSILLSMTMMRKRVVNYEFAETL